MKSKHSARLSLLFFLVGLLLLCFLVNEVGLAVIVDKLAQLRWRLLYVFLFPLSWYSIQSFAWWRVLTDSGASVSYWHVFLAKITGEAVNTVTPVSFVGGDPYRIYMLQKKVSGTASAASVVVDRTMYILAVVLLLLTALIGAIWVLPLPGAWRILFPAITVALVLLVGSLIFWQTRGLFGGVARKLQKFGIQQERLDRWTHKIQDLDQQVGAFYRKNKVHFFEIMVLQYIGRFLGVFEIYLIVHLLGLPVDLVQCLFLASLTILINLSFFFVPGSMGVMESGYGALFYLLNLNPAFGVAIQLVRRLRTFFWIGMGLLIILLYRPKDTEDESVVSSSMVQ